MSFFLANFRKITAAINMLINLDNIQVTEEIGITISCNRLGIVSSLPALASSSAMQFPKKLLCSGIHTRIIYLLNGNMKSGKAFLEKFLTLMAMDGQRNDVRLGLDLAAWLSK